MTGLIATIEFGPRLGELYGLLERCSDEIESCAFCSHYRECDNYCDLHLYDKKEVTQKEFIEYMTEIMRLRQVRKKLARPAPAECSIEFPVLRHRESSLVCF